MVRSRTWKLAAPALAGFLAWTQFGCGESPPAAPAETPKAVAQAEPPKPPKGKKVKDPNLDMGFRELREQRRKAQGTGPTP